MERITITIDDDLLASVDALVNAKGYTSRSEAIRDLLRAGARAEHVADTDTPCVATLTYIYNHAQRDLPQRLADAQHDRHDLSVATTHVHFGHEDCLEVAILRGPAAAISAHANELTAQRGVRHANLHLIPVRGGHTHSHHGHTHHHGGL
jgi:CopG family nickel-responsive transcriptional regulator